MKKIVDQIIEGISGKYSIPTEKAQQISHFNKLFECFHQLGSYIEKNSSVQAELKENYTSLEKLLTDSLAFNFIDYANQDTFARAIGRVIMATIKQDSGKSSSLLDLMVNGIKPKNIQKTNHFQVLIFVMEFRRNITLSYPQLNEVLQNLLKILKKNNEIPLRINSMKVFRYLIREQVNVNANNKAETYKLITKFMFSDKSDELRKEAMITLIDFLKFADAPFMAPNYEALLTDIYKQLQESKDWVYKKACAESIELLLELYINSDMENLIKELKAKKGKKEQPKPAPESTEPKDKFKIILNLLTDHLNEHGKNLRLIVIEIFYNIIYKQESNMSMTFFSNILEFFFSQISKMAFAQDHDTFVVRDIMGMFIIKLLVFLNNKQKFELYEYLKRKLPDFGKAYKDIYLRYLQNPNNLNSQKNQQSLQHQSLIALRCFFALVQILGSDLFEQIKKPNEMCELLSPFFQFNNPQFYLLGSHVMKALFSENPKWQTNILSLILNQMTLDLAELESMKEVCNIQDPQFKLYVSSIYGHSIALGTLLKHMDFNLHSIPYDIAMTMFEFAKGLVKTEYKSEDPHSEELHFINSIRYQAGWTLINTLLCLDVNWLKQEIKSIYNMWQDVLGQKRKETSKLSNFISDLNAKRKALKGIHYFLKNLNRLHTEMVLKFCANLVINFYQQYIAPTEKDLGFQIPKNHNDLVLAKIDLYSCLNLFPPKLISQHINALIQTSVDDIFTMNQNDFTPSLKGLMDGDDLNIGLELQESNVRFKLFNSSNIKKLQDHNIQRNEDYLLTYDQVYLKYQEKNYAFSIQLCFQQFEFIGRILASHSFTSKNKINLLKYMVNNQSGIFALKDQNLKFLKLQPFLLVSIFIARKIREAQSKNNLEPIEVEIVQYLKQMTESGFSSDDHIIRTLAGGSYALLVGIKTNTPYVETLIKNLQEKIVKNELSSSIVSCAGFICKYNKFKVIEEHIQSIAGIFQKASKNPDQSTQLWLIQSLTKVIESYQEDSIEIIRSCFLFINMQHLRQVLPFEYLWNQLYKTMLEKILKLIRKIPKMIEDKAIFSNFQSSFWEVQHQVFPYIDIPSADTQVLANHLHLIFSSIFKSPQDQEKALYGLRQDLDQIYKYNNSSVQIVLKTIEKMINDRKKTIEKMTNDKNSLEYLKTEKEYLLNHLIRKMNYFNTRKDYYIAENIEVLYSNLIEEKEKFSLSVCQKKLEMFSFILFGESFEIKKGDDDEAVNKKQNEKKEYSKEDLIDINLRTKIFVLSCVENFLREWDPKDIAKDSIANFTQFIFTFIFKIVTSSHEEFRAPGMQILMNFLAKIKKMTGDGEMITGKINYEEQRNLLLKDYPAQIDSVVSQNIKNESENTPEVNIFTFQLMSKFFKIILDSDIGFIKRLINLVSKPLLNNIKITFQSFYSEKSTTSIQIRRIECLCKIYIFIQNRVKNRELQQSLFGAFPPILLMYLLQNVQAAILDTSVVLAASRKQIKSYNNYYLIYNGVKTSYDVKMHYYMLSNFVKYYLVLSEAVKNIQIDNQEQQDLINKLKSNEKYLNHGPKMSHICYSTLLFQLCSNTSIDQEEQYIKKIQTQMVDISLLKKLNHKLQILGIMKQLLESRMSELLTEEQPALFNNFTQKTQNVQKISFEELFEVLIIYLDYGLLDFDQICIEIATITVRAGNLLSEQVLNQIEQMLEIILARYLEKKMSSQQDSITYLNIIKSSFILKLSILKSLNQLNCFSEKFSFTAYILFTKLCYHFSYNDILPLRRAFTTILKDKIHSFPQTEESEKAIEQIINSLIDLHSFEIDKNGANQENRLYFCILNYFSVHDSLISNINRLNSSSTNKLNSMFSACLSHLLKNLQSITTFLSYTRSVFNENKILDDQLISPIFFICLNVMQKLKSVLQQGQQLDEQLKNSVIEVLKIFLLVNVHGNEQQKKNCFEFFLRFFMLFVNQRFSQPDAVDILQLVNQILKHVVSSVSLQDIGVIIKTLPPKLQQVLQNLLKADSRVIQAQQQAQQQQQQQQQQQNKPTLQLKTFS
ncbi:hypothetical protein TTHERM_00357140 (macronuclear) [Tetrahymena thermophila SB210]|uniref:Uncharacterized protein n=1 Tax=Tetrahymena thermophila (strain SB210) TaxID=312017 RepID=Q22XV7_TETTS|nr:hypothetical protein TTHERM_00357140 [Tetrahymena thermophila SB210]EAR90267.2 hypothetical protein TTHERM_00357140 [Tetrahymena thermophila SB210]|eukprot:XP_001010512.2 hypothetical protein TTHERM_00357140 [Tetrahymena thermophila SB210]